MATLASQTRLLVVRERSATLPDLDDGKFAALSRRSGAHQNVTLLSQFDDEPRSLFIERVSERIERDLRQAVEYRGVIVSLTERIEDAEVPERRRLVQNLADVLASRPNGSLMLVAPATADSALRGELLDLAETVARGAPLMNVTVSFFEAKAAQVATKGRLGTHGWGQMPRRGNVRTTNSRSWLADRA